MRRKKKVFNQHQVFHGKELLWEIDDITEENYQSVLMTGLNYYSTIPLKERRKYFIKWAKEQGKTSDELSGVPTDFLITISSMCRMVDRGFIFNEKDNQYMVDKLDYLIKEYQYVDNNNIVDEDEERLKKIYKKEAIDILIGDILNHFDVVIDEQLISDNKLKISSIDCSNLNVGQFKYIIDYYQKQLTELKLVYNKADKELMEGYQHISRIKLKRLMNLHVNIIDEVKRGKLFNKAKRSTRTRKKKIKTADQLTSNVKFMNVSEEYNIVSIDPAKIIGKNILYLFNTKYRKLQIYKSSIGFNMKGTTLQNFNKEVSYQKTIRKPKEFFDKFINESKVKSNKMIDDVNSKKGSVTGRINELSIIVKIY